MTMSDKILCVGLVVVDIMTEVNSYPTEDNKSRCDAIYERIGGNAASNCSVLSILGEKTSFLGCVGTSTQHFQLVMEFFAKYNVDSTPMIMCDGHPMPLSICIINKTTGTRTCLHCRGTLPELFHHLFLKAKIDLPSYKWVHFEGRYDYSDTKQQIEYIHGLREADGHKFKLSVELEKASEALVPLLDANVEYVFASKDFAKLMGYKNMSEAARGLSERVKNGTTVICPWGDQGAAAQAKGGELATSPAFAPSEVINTLGAGDTFIAACIKALSNDNDLSSSLRFACKVAGAKCGLRDLDELIGMDFTS